ncbi:MAG: hypothetical protein KDB94_08830, partial [Acidobacteria bacterium]|nr:hypothetical protein [Acidobacteriota bacterium]
GDNIARGYVTADVVWDCTLLTPCDPGYFTLSEGLVINAGPDDFLIGSYDNAIWGDWYMIDYANNFAQGDTLVHVESICADPEANQDEDCHEPFYYGGAVGVSPLAVGGKGEFDYPFPEITFWGRCSTFLEAGNPDPLIQVDLREPLATTFASRFYQNAAFDGGTDFLVWRDSLFNVALGDEDGFSCSSGPDWYPLNERQVVFFDEQENPETVCTISPCPEEDILFPLETQRVSVGDLDITPESGWAYMNLNQVWNLPVHGATVLAAQAWVTAVHSAEGRFSAGLSAVQLDSACDFQSVLIGEYDDYPVIETAYPWTYYFYSSTHGGDN